MQYRKKGAQGPPEETSGRGRRDDRGGRKSFRRGGGPSYGGRGGPWYKPKQESSQFQYQPKGSGTAGEHDKMEKGAPSRNDPDQGRPRRQSDRQVEYQPKYRVKGEQSDDYPPNNEEVEENSRDYDEDRGNQDTDNRGWMNDMPDQLNNDPPQMFHNPPANGENPSNSQSSYNFNNPNPTNIDPYEHNINQYNRFGSYSGETRGFMGTHGQQDGQRYMEGPPAAFRGRAENEFQGQAFGGQMQDYGARFNEFDHHGPPGGQPYNAEAMHAARGQHPNEAYHQSNQARFGSPAYSPSLGPNSFGQMDHGDPYWQQERANQQFGQNMGVNQRGFGDFYDDRQIMDQGQVPEFHPSQGFNNEMREGYPDGGYPQQARRTEGFSQQMTNPGGFSAEAQPFQPRREPQLFDESHVQDQVHGQSKERQNLEPQPQQQQFKNERSQERAASGNRNLPEGHSKRAESKAQQPSEMKYQPKGQNNRAQPQGRWQPKGSAQQPDAESHKYRPKEYRPKDKDRDEAYDPEYDRYQEKSSYQNRERQPDNRRQPYEQDPREYERQSGRGRRGRGRGRGFDDRFVEPRGSRGRGGEPYHPDRRFRGGYRGHPEYKDDYYDRQGPIDRHEYGHRRRGRDEDYEYDYSRDYDYGDRRGGADYDNYLDRSGYYSEEDYDDYYQREAQYDQYRRSHGPRDWNREMEMRKDADRKSFGGERRRPDRAGPREGARGADPEDYYYEEDERSYEYDDRERNYHQSERGRTNQRRPGPKKGRSESYDYVDEDPYYDKDPYYDEEEEHQRDHKRRDQDRYFDDDQAYHDDYGEEKDERSRRPENSRQNDDKSAGRNRPYRRGNKRADNTRRDERETEDREAGGRHERRGRGGRRERERQDGKAARGRGLRGRDRQGSYREERDPPRDSGYRQKAGISRQMTQGTKEEAAGRASADRPRSSEHRDRRGKKEYRKKAKSLANESEQSAEDNVDDRDSMGEIDEQKVDDFADDEFKWDDKDFEEDEPEFLAATSTPSHADEPGARSSTASTSTASGVAGGNNQVSRRFYQLGQQTDHVKAPCTVMMVAEKPSIALSITEALCGKDFQKRTGPAKGIPIFTFKGHFKGHAANFKVTSVAGHVYNRDFPLEFQNRSKDPAILFDAPTIKSCDRRARPVAKQLQMVAKNLDFMVLWLDCDKEGENICFEVLDICKKSIPRSSGRVQRVFRAKFSSIAKKDIVNAFEGLKHEPNYNEAISVDARQVLDLKIGVAFSRFQTSRLASSIRKAGIRMLTYGPCQTPTLGFCVDQAEKIKKFVPETFWRVEAQMVDENGRTHSMKWCRGKIFDKTAVQVIHERLQRHYGGKEAEVLSVKRNVVKQVRPQGLNTVKLLKVGSQSYGLSAYETMRIAEHLYLSGYTTYPRTESTTFSSNFNFKEVLTALKEHEDFGSYAQKLLKQGINKPRKGVDAGDHPPITPVKAAGRGQLRDRELKIYEYITANFLGCISEDATYEALRSELLIGEEKFKLKGQILKEEGFVEVMPWQRHSDLEVPLYEIGDIIDIVSTRVTETKTEPPGYLTEAELIEKMEKHAIGTDASIPTHIANIIERNYVTVQDPGRKLIPTPLGHALVKGYCEIDPELVLPQVRSNIEKSCELIAKGKADFQKVMGHVLHIFKNKFNFFKLSVGTMERILNIMLNVGDANNSACLAAKIRLKDESKDSFINFCIKCFKGHFCLQYHQKKGWGLKCDSCNFAVRVCQGAARVRRETAEDSKCQECGSYCVDVYYKDSSPFPAGEPSHTGCLLCDTWLRTLVKNPLKTQQPKLMTAAEAEEAQRQKEARKKLKEEKKAQRDKEGETATGAGGAQTTSTAGGTAQSQTAGTKKKAKSKANKGAKAVGDLLTAEERMNEFMSKFQ